MDKKDQLFKNVEDMAFENIIKVASVKREKITFEIDSSVLDAFTRHAGANQNLIIEELMKYFLSKFQRLNSDSEQISQQNQTKESKKFWLRPEFLADVKKSFDELPEGQNLKKSDWKLLLQGLCEKHKQNFELLPETLYIRGAWRIYLGRIEPDEKNASGR